MLEQQYADSCMYAIAYASHRCSDAEAKYGLSEGELLALVFAMTKFHH